MILNSFVWNLNHFSILHFDYRIKLSLQLSFLFVSLSGQLRIFLRLVPIPEDPVPCSCLSPVLAPVRLAAVVCIDCVPLRFLVCRWQKNKDLNWAWSRSKLDLNAANKSELQLAKERDADLMAQML